MIYYLKINKLIIFHYIASDRVEFFIFIYTKKENRIRISQMLLNSLMINNEHAHNK